MNIHIEKGIANGTVLAPPSKSMAHRLLICAALSRGESVIKNLSFSEDISATADCIRALGADCRIEGDTAFVCGIDFNKTVNNTLCCRESGSTIRFFVPICLLFSNEITLTGSEYLLKRPMNIYADICKERGLTFDLNDKNLTVKGKLESGIFKMPGNVSSQFVSGLLFVLPLLSGDSKIELIGGIESKSYIEMTISALSCFGVSISWENENTLYIKGNQKYKPQNLAVEGDYSNTAFFEALNIFGGNVLVEGLNKNSLQGDRVYLDIMPKLLSGTPTVDIKDCPDLAPVLFAVAAANNGARFTGTKRLKIKESDRGSAMREELSKFGIESVIEENEITVFKGELKPPKAILDGHNDHRIVMALSVLSTLTGGEIEGAEAVKKSFPDFFTKLSGLGIKVTGYDNK